VLLAVTLQHAITARLPGYGGGITQAAALAAAHPGTALPALAGAFGATFWVALALAAAALIPALLLPGRAPSGARHQPAAEPADAADRTAAGPHRDPHS